MSNPITNATIQNAEGGFLLNDVYIGQSFETGSYNRGNLILTEKDQQKSGFVIDLNTVTIKDKSGSDITPGTLVEKAIEVNKITSKKISSDPGVIVQDVNVISPDPLPVSIPNDQISSFQEIKKINGKFAGTFFGDDFTVTNRTAVLAAKYSQGLPSFATKNTFANGGRWYLLDDPAALGFKDGTCCFETTTNAAGKCFISTEQANRYLPGHLSYFGYTAAWEGVSSSNGDFIALVGAVQRGPVSLGRSDDIKEAFMWGYIRQGGPVRQVLRVYKNYEFTDYDVVNQTGIDYTNLRIFEHQIGYYGIHPSIIWVFDPDKEENVLLDFHKFESVNTSVQDPNLALGVIVENKGNTSNIRILNGSVEYGNYTERDNPTDASGRDVSDRILDAGPIAVDPTDQDLAQVVGAYTISDVITSVTEVNAIGVLTADFAHRIENQLLSVSVAGDAADPVSLNLYFIPASDVVATFTDVIPGVSVLRRAENADITSVNFTNAMFQFSIQITAGGGFLTGGFGSDSQLLKELAKILRSGTVAVFTLQSVSPTTLDDFRLDIISRDLF